ncbi:duboraya [Labrus bergylta]|uniref:CapZ-interacting protein-like n=1 Tax=Labrus bergylta TaxID=56723 RepID=A0A3Q3E8E4_9LABR|nr:capZ-interacting protein-like [Labrus bergylta]
MEEEALPRRSVADLAGRFKGLAPPQDAAGEKTEKPVRRRPPRSLQIPKPHEDNQEPEGVTSTLPVKVKRNSALIEKLQANLALSPTALLPSPKSPGFRLLPPSFPPQSPVSAPVTTVTTTPSTPTPLSPVATSPLTEEEGPASFEAPPIPEEGSILSNINKSRARHSTRRRPPSRRHRKTSSGDEVGLSSSSEQGDKKTDRAEEEGVGEGVGEGGQDEDKTGEVKEEKTDASMKNETHEEEKSEIDVESREDDTKDGAIPSTGGGEEASSSRTREEEEEAEKNSGGKHEEESTEGATNTESREEEKSAETTCQTSYL